MRIFMVVAASQLKGLRQQLIRAQARLEVRRDCYDDHLVNVELLSHGFQSGSNGFWHAGNRTTSNVLQDGLLVL
jgi:hypothetical protein